MSQMNLEPERIKVEHNSFVLDTDIRLGLGLAACLLAEKGWSLRRVRTWIELTTNTTLESPFASDRCGRLASLVAVI
jgi:hypothetical protein